MVFIKPWTIETIAIIVEIFLIISGVYGGATEEQMNSAGKLMRDVCFPKFPKVTIEMANDINKGKLHDDKDSKCYINCIMEMMQTIKKGKILYESSLKQIDILMPDEYKDDYKKGFAVCKDATAGIKNNCDAAYNLLVCLKKNIQIFVFP